MNENWAKKLSTAVIMGIVLTVVLLAIAIPATTLLKPGEGQTPSSAPSGSATLEIHFIDMGQGDSIYIRTPGDAE